MSIFFYIDDDLINFDDPTGLVKDEYRAFFARRELAPYLFSEICVLDIVFAVAKMDDGYYLDRLVLKGGLSVRNHVSLVDHRFSFDADYNPNTPRGYTFGDVDGIGEASLSTALEEAARPLSGQRGMMQNSISSN